MIRKILFIVFFFTPVMIFAQQQAISIIPKPVSLKVETGQNILDSKTAINYDANNKHLLASARYLANYIKGISGYKLSMNKSLRNKIILKIVHIPELKEEGYQLHITPTVISIKANTGAGIFYGIQSLIQTFPQVRTNAKLTIPCMDVTDFPRFQWRGMHLDVVRHFFPLETIKEYLDLMAMYKLNVFHWHLCDDQGWRIEIKKYPKLTSVAAWRPDRRGLLWDACAPASEGEPATYGGFYTQEEIKEIVAYANNLHITIVPEIEMPGHSAEVITTFPGLSCTQSHTTMITGGQYPKEYQRSYCAGNDSSFIFLQDILSEVIRLFPSKYIHIGGDEVSKTFWQQCPKCQARMKKEGLANENELQSYFIRRIEKFINSKHRKLIGWDEILEGGLAPDATVMSWRGEKGGIQAAKMKHDVVMTPGYPLYFDHYQAGPDGEPQAAGGFNSAKNIYDYNPIPAELTPEESTHILGAQGNVWAEFISTREHLEYMVLPRMLALSEMVWSPRESKDWNDFSKRLEYHFTAFEQKGYRYCPGNFSLTIKPQKGQAGLEATILSETPDADIYYTTDGSYPTAGGKKYQEPIPVNTSMTIKAISVYHGVPQGTVASQSFLLHKALGAKVSYQYPCSSTFQADGPNTLTDGIRGGNNQGKYWYGFETNDLSATIDMGGEKYISSITLGCLQRLRSRIFLPTQVKFEVSEDGTNYTEVKTIVNDISPNETANILKDFTANFHPVNARYLRVTAKNLGVVPKGLRGEGRSVFVLSDEIVVN